MSAPQLPRLLSTAMVMRETGLPRDSARRVMSRLTILRPTGVGGRPFVYRDELERLLRDSEERR